MKVRHAVALACAALVATGCAADRREVAYTDYFQAKAQDAIKREWVPEWLPETTTDIREVHAGDTGRALLRATWPTDADLPTDCVPVDVPPPPSFGADWFPEDAVQLGQVHVCDDEGYVVIADGVLYRWTTGHERTEEV